VLSIIQRGEHLTLGGLQKIVALKANLNLGLSDSLKEAFPYTCPVINKNKRPVVVDQVIRDPN
jgi:hypothetical protein